ncbi:ABC transporter ATP-binding protein [Paenibacillus sp. TRM 82003]|nr:ABC transporter ATP-binding protein [Paenibacillus sp. TRM 82003]
MDKNVLLRVENLKTRFQTVRGPVTAVDGISFHIRQGEILGVVGESGCGKSVTSRSIMRLYDENRAVRHEGKVIYKDRDLLACSKKEMRRIRGSEISMIFQDTLSSLNPVYTVGNQIDEAIALHRGLPRREAARMTVDMLRAVGIPDPEKRYRDYPHQLSGGMRQRIMIAMALACEPSLLIADEPTTALDVTIQAQILELIGKLKDDFGMSILLITHDLGVVAESCTRVVVMYLGQIVEEADVESLFERPMHPYTKGLLRSMPKVNGDRFEKLESIPGTVPSLFRVPTGCRFAGRCPHVDRQCVEQAPELVPATDGHLVRCWHAEAIRSEGAVDDAEQRCFGT